MIFHLVLLCWGTTVTYAQNYVNNFDQEFSFTCDHPYQTISHVESIHDNGAEDRRFAFGCRDVLPDQKGSRPQCYWSGFENQYDLPVVFQCPRNNYINGMGSVHDNGAEDRIWKFYCCQLPDIHMFDCSFTDWTNVFDGAQNFNSPDGLVMKGMDSYHDNNFEDRRFKYELCTPYVMDGLIVVG
ncbi:hemagglutinin/amebocyte aggregation factor-like [Dreissena polymorpha]|uniref:Dermatopontin n=1 Tax=Dreissena polymorpha TaxID=45954 RepID=A0A9D4HA78_DREPO|nr:hemagglutinin/amebocyte aggregation factor-like [Dreissena polymorpha]XP_052282805.1 hemagglutinin/amebocyte aggregation factor-like [Dreissena polymorpha]KAH3830445.1 hypothetical protein DPMN_103689 [Dreissena polymorpha]